jgi:hypothetical protein
MKRKSEMLTIGTFLRMDRLRRFQGAESLQENMDYLFSSSGLDS